MEKINIAELLKNCPKGMELDCTCADNVVFDKIIEYEQIKCVIGDCHDPLILDKYGRLLYVCFPKCVIFPKGKTTWEGFHRPFKDGDVIHICDEYSDITYTYVAIFKQIEKGGKVYSHCFYDYEYDEFNTHDYLHDDYSIRFATEEEKAKLFDAIKANGYKWNAETKTLEKLIQPKFKVGDRIKEKQSGVTGEVTDVQQKKYNVKIDDNKGLYVYFREQDEWELVPNKFDIHTLVPFDKVLMRSSNAREWVATFYSHYSNNKFYGCGMCCDQCIPFVGNEHLLGTTNDCDEYFKTWK